MFYILTTGIIFILEYHIKQHMDKARTLKQCRPLAGGKIVLKKYYNPGAAGDFLKNHPKYVCMAHTAAMFAVCSALAYTLPKKENAGFKTGLAFLAGGGLSNLYDRISKGYVIDYISFGFGPKWFRRLVFNTADFFIFAGMALFSKAYVSAK